MPSHATANRQHHRPGHQGPAQGNRATQSPVGGMNYAAGQHYLSPDGGRAGTTPSSDGLLRQGSKGSAVTTLQTQLLRHGAAPGPIDGDFGPATKAAVIRFQRSHGLDPDGMVGPQTQAALSQPVTTAPAAGGNASAPRGNRRVKPQQISAGAKGADVLLLQSALIQRGYHLGEADSEFGPRTKAALIAFQRASGLDADGVAGEMTWKALGYVMGGDARDTNAHHDPAPRPGSGGGHARPPMIPRQGEAGLREAILEQARGELGKRERGWNGGDAEKYQKFFGRGHEPWCADFVSWVYTQAGQKMNNPYVPGIVQQLKKSGRWRTSSPKPGDMVIFDWDHDGVGDHIGIVESTLPNGHVRTIEGNTSDPTGRNGEGVYERTRTRSTILGYGDAVG